jgi:cytochrome c peroxidase
VSVSAIARIRSPRLSTQPSTDKSSGTYQDDGRFAVTGRETDRGAFKTPTVRDVARTAPYMHDGSLATLEDVVDFYDTGGRANRYLDADIRPLRLAAYEKRALVRFLGTLTGSRDSSQPASVPSASPGSPILSSRSK